MKRQIDQMILNKLLNNIYKIDNLSLTICSSNQLNPLLYSTELVKAMRKIREEIFIMRKHITDNCICGYCDNYKVQIGTTTHYGDVYKCTLCGCTKLFTKEDWSNKDKEFYKNHEHWNVSYCESDEETVSRYEAFDPD
jgi:hypothetical protein